MERTSATPQKKTRLKKGRQLSRSIRTYELVTHHLHDIEAHVSHFRACPASFPPHLRDLSCDQPGSLIEREGARRSGEETLERAAFGSQVNHVGRKRSPEVDRGLLARLEGRQEEGLAVDQGRASGVLRRRRLVKRTSSSPLGRA
jgi:hypothetical protein